MIQRLGFFNLDDPIYMTSLDDCWVFSIGVIALPVFVWYVCSLFVWLLCFFCLVPERLHVPVSKGTWNFLNFATNNSRLIQFLNPEFSMFRTFFSMGKRHEKRSESFPKGYPEKRKNILKKHFPKLFSTLFWMIICVAENMPELAGCLLNCLRPFLTIRDLPKLAPHVWLKSLVGRKLFESEKFWNFRNSNNYRVNSKELSQRFHGKSSYNSTANLTQSACMEKCILQTAYLCSVFWTPKIAFIDVLR